MLGRRKHRCAEIAGLVRVVCCVGFGGISPESGSGPGLTPDGSSYVTSSCGANTQGAAADPMDMPSGRSSGRNRASAPQAAPGNGHMR